MVSFLVTLGLLGGSLWALRGGYAGSGPGLRQTGLDPNALGLTAVAVIAAVWFFGWMYGAAFVLAVMLHEYGHVAAYRVCGHSDARFRLLPLLGGQAISSRLPSSHEEEAFITLMGPAFSLAPMLVLINTAHLLWQVSPTGATFCTILGLVMGGLNAFNLMPFWPLDGGRLLRIVTYTFAPGLAQPVTLAMSALAAALAVITQSYFLFFFVLLGLSSLLQGNDVIHIQRRMSRRRGLLVLAAWIVTTVVFAQIAYPLIGMLG
jgi:Zn-dependent protease